MDADMHDPIVPAMTENAPKETEETVRADHVWMRDGQHWTPPENWQAVPKEDWVISKDGPHTISPSRRWLARQLMDSHLSDAEALSVVAYAPEVRAALTSEQGADQ